MRVKFARLSRDECFTLIKCLAGLRSRFSSLHKASAAAAANALAKFVGFATRVGANPDLVEHASPSAAKQYRLGARTNNGA